MAGRGSYIRRSRQNSNVTRLSIHKTSYKQCTFKRYACPLPCIEGYFYCSRHILDDETAPFRQCSYTYPSTSKKCSQAAPKIDSPDSYCPEHYLKMQRAKNRVGKNQPPLSSEKLLTSLSHYVRMDKDSNAQGISDDVDVCGDFIGNPFADINLKTVNDSLSSVLDYCSESDSDIEACIISRTTRCKDEDSSEAESVDSTEEDIFKHVSVMSTIEAMHIAKDKMLRLKRLYTDQLKHLSGVLRDRRREYLVNIQKERESNCSISEQEKATAREFKLMDKIKSSNHYRRRYGEEAVLRKKMLEKRGLALDNIVSRVGAKCVFTEGGVKCCVRTLPSSKFCPKHILTDISQVLFHPCGFVNGDHTCLEPLPAMEPCAFHMDLPPIQITYNTAMSSEDDEENNEGAKTVFEAEVPMQEHHEHESLKTKDLINDSFITGIKEEYLENEPIYHEESMSCDNISHFEDVHTTC